MTNTHYIGIPIILTKDEVRNLIDLDVRPLSKADESSLETLEYLNSQIVAQLADYCVHHQSTEHLPLSITVAPQRPLIKAVQPRTDLTDMAIQATTRGRCR
ncbi:hypothetical protein MNBD_GAMMA10-98 [hydrothermal vent metagenome]|uniref:Uncharacterized protein n=1 Tax=hydrothermal vent metagenome TaxID=652676 RepID=A0A3B0YDN5_9ZZZZ